MEKEKNKLIEFIYKKRKQIELKNKPKEENKIRWYNKELKSEDFVYRLAKDKKFYVRHNEWGKKIWIGPYSNEDDCKKIITSYVEISSTGKDEIFKTSKTQFNNVHSVIIDNLADFF